MFVTTTVTRDQRIKVGRSSDGESSVEIGTDYPLGPDGSTWWAPSLCIFLTNEQAADLHEQLGRRLAEQEVEA